MTVSEAIALVDVLEPNSYTEQQKILWLNELDGQVFHELILTHEHEEGAEFTPLSSEEDELLIPFPYTEIYNYWMQARIAIENAETQKYAVQMQLFNAAYENYCHFVNRTHRPIGAWNRWRF